MRQETAGRVSFLTRIALAALLLGLSQSVAAHETAEKIADPGFRPESEHAAAFLDALDSATIAVYPTIIRRANRTANSYESRDQIVAFLNEHDVVRAVQGSKRVDLGKLPRMSQWDLFTSDMQRIGASAKGRRADAQYHLFMEILLPVSDGEVFGVECYILDSDGNNAFSFLLNSHHQMFVEASLFAKNSSEAARSQLLEKASLLGVTALQAQIEQARERAALAPPITPEQIEAGVFDDFESGLQNGSDKHGIPVGYVAITDGSSTVQLATSADYPPLPGVAADNQVLRLDFNVSGWAAFAHIFANDALDAWVPYDWSAFDEFSFWLYGNNSGTSLFVDILDNRKPWSTVDDAERYVHYFNDDFSGWKRVAIRFADMHRKPTGNSPPNDGLGLLAVHGWAFGVASQSGPITYYLDDFELRTVPGVGGTFFHESPIDETSSIISFIEGDTGGGYAVHQSITVFCEAVKLTKFKGYNLFRIEDPREPGDKRMRARISFYEEPPADLPVLSLTDPGEIDNPETYVIDAGESSRYCDLLEGARPPASVAKLSNDPAEGLVSAPSSKQKRCAGAVKADYPINELAMYGHVEKTPDLLRADETYIQRMTRNGMSREGASTTVAKLGWNTYYSGDCSRAMRLFNQAWLLDPDNQLALWGFAVISLERDQFEDSMHYFEMARQTGPENPALQEDYEHVSNLR